MDAMPNPPEVPALDFLQRAGGKGTGHMEPED
jgi:hypothetical protein